MQRRAAAVYIVFFVVVAIGAYSLITVAEEPTASVEGTSYSQGQNLTTPGGEVWTVNVSNGSGTVSRVNESVRFTASFANGTNLTRRNGIYRPASNGSGGGGAAGTATTSSNGSGGGAASTETGSTTDGGTTTTGGANTTASAGGNASAAGATRFRVVIANGSAGNATGTNATGTNASGGNASSGNASTGNTSTGNASGGNASGGNASGANVSSFTLRETFDVNQRLRDDPDVANTTLSGNGTQYVRYRNGTTRPLDEYLPTPEVRNVSVGDSFPYRNNSTTVAGVNTTGVSLAWNGSQTESMELEAGENVTLGNTTYVAQFGADNSTVTLSRDVVGYQEELADVSGFHDRILGLWGIAIISVFAAILIAALAYLPVRG